MPPFGLRKNRQEAKVVLFLEGFSYWEFHWPPGLVGWTFSSLGQ